MTCNTKTLIHTSNIRNYNYFIVTKIDIIDRTMYTNDNKEDSRGSVMAKDRDPF